MGRPSSGYLETQVRRYVRLFRVKLDSGGYDDGGAYWGHGEPIWCAIDDEGNMQTVRAPHRESAAFQLDLPTGALKVPLTYWNQWGMAWLAGERPVPGGMTRDDVSTWLKRCGLAMGQSEDMTPKPYAE